MLGVILGNGPSKHCFDRNGDFVIGCNIPGDAFSVDATVIADEEIVWILKSTPNIIQCPIIVSTKAWEKMKELRIDDQFTILHVFKPKEWYNAAHYAADFLLEFGECDGINIWGCDSIFQDNIESTTDQFVKKENTADMKFIRNWRRIWDDIFDQNPNVNFNAMRVD
jgi:hypothetical protein